MCTPAGLWWVAPCPVLVTSATAIIAELVWHSNHAAYVGTKAQLVGVARGTLHGFPVTAAAELAVLLVVAVRWRRARSRTAGRGRNGVGARRGTPDPYRREGGRSAHV